MVDQFGVARDLGADHAGGVTVRRRAAHRADALAVDTPGQRRGWRGNHGGRPMRMSRRMARSLASGPRPWQSGRGPGLGDTNMLTRRRLLAGSTATLAAPYVANHTVRRAEERRGDGAADRRHRLLRPAVAGLHDNEVDGNCYRRSYHPDPATSTKVAGDVARRADVSADGLTFTYGWSRSRSSIPATRSPRVTAAFSLRRRASNTTHHRHPVRLNADNIGSSSARWTITRSK